MYHIARFAEDHVRNTSFCSALRELGIDETGMFRPIRYSFENVSLLCDKINRRENTNIGRGENMMISHRDPQQQRKYKRKLQPNFAEPMSTVEPRFISPIRTLYHQQEGGRTLQTPTLAECNKRTRLRVRWICGTRTTATASPHRPPNKQTHKIHPLWASDSCICDNQRRNFSCQNADIMVYTGDDRREGYPTGGIRNECQRAGAVDKMIGVIASSVAFGCVTLNDRRPCGSSNPP